MNMHKLSLDLYRNGRRLGSFEQVFNSRDEALACVRRLIDSGFDINWAADTLIVQQQDSLQ